MPKRKNDIILVCDIESTCWPGDRPPGEVSEIIEVGLVALSIPTLEIVDYYDSFLRPVESTISPFCTQLTGVTADDVSHGVGLEYVCNIIAEDFHGSERLWASYGDYDRQQFERQCARRQVPYPFGPRHLNIKTLLMLTYGWDKELGMAEALAWLGLPLVGNHHRALDDAKNIATLLATALKDARSGALLRREEMTAQATLEARDRAIFGEDA
jgi:inhibitor of KinA sporulation pathway (predicted exonuclease)